MKNPSEILNLHYDHEESKRIRSLIKENFDKGNWRYSDEETFEDLAERSENILNHLLKNHYYSPPRLLATARWRNWERGNST
jgi:hypothetical protein